MFDAVWQCQVSSRLWKNFVLTPFQLKTAFGTNHFNNGSTYVETPRLQEQFGYAYDKGWNLAYRTNNALVDTFKVNKLNELTTNSWSGTLTVAGTAMEQGAMYGGANGVSKVAGLWDAASAVDPFFLTDAIEYAAGVRPDDF